MKRVAILFTLLLALLGALLAGCATRLLPAREVRADHGRRTLCASEGIEVAHLGRIDADPTVDAWRARGCGREIWYRCAPHGSLDGCAPLPLPPHFSPAQEEPHAIVRVRSVMRDAPITNERVLAQTVLIDGRYRLHLQQRGDGAARAFPVAPGLREIAVVSTPIAEEQRVVLHTHSIATYSQATLGAGCPVSLTLEVEDESSYQLTYERDAEGCSLRCEREVQTAAGILTLPCEG
ncbi:MAG: hypothetical protein OEY14_16215 [Myxococcales bacterium]|nr:hypothetical protein [Myxococcales bacterium]